MTVTFNQRRPGRNPDRPRDHEAPSSRETTPVQRQATPPQFLNYGQQISQDIAVSAGVDAYEIRRDRPPAAADDSVPADVLPEEIGKQSQADLDAIREVLGNTIKTDVLPMLSRKHSEVSALFERPVLRDRHAETPTASELLLLERATLIRETAAVLVNMAIGREQYAAVPGDAARKNLEAAVELLRSIHVDCQLDIECIMLEIVGPAAQQLGVLWEEDAADFTLVTVGSNLLVQLAYRLHHQCPFTPKGPRGRIALGPMSGEQHSLGATLLSIMLQRRGWSVMLEPGGDLQRLRENVANEHVDVIGISISAEIFASQLASEISSLRDVSVNKDVIVMVGGRICNDDRADLSLIGADLILADRDHSNMAAVIDTYGVS